MWYPFPWASIKVRSQMCSLSFPSFWWHIKMRSQTHRGCYRVQDFLSNTSSNTFSIFQNPNLDSKGPRAPNSWRVYRMSCHLTKDNLAGTMSLRMCSFYPREELHFSSRFKQSLWKISQCSENEYFIKFIIGLASEHICVQTDLFWIKVRI